MNTPAFSSPGPGSRARSMTCTRALVSLLLIRDIESRVGNGRATLISEICDPRTKRLVTIADVSDYVVSNEIISMSLAQVSEHQDIADVWEELFDPDGNEVYLKDPRRYCGEGETLSFWDLSARGRQRGEVVLGFKRADRLQPVINPADKSKPITLGAGDQVVVISLEQT